MTCVRQLVLLILALAAATAAAQQYPTKTVRLIVGFPPGGGTDIVTRLIAQRLTETWKQQFIVDNRPGATGMIGANIVAKAPPDGYTLLTGHVNSNAIAPWMVLKPLYDPLTDFAAIAYIGYAPNVLVVHPSTPASLPSPRPAWAAPTTWRARCSCAPPASSSRTCRTREAALRSSTYWPGTS